MSFPAPEILLVSPGRETDKPCLIVPSGGVEESIETTPRSASPDRMRERSTSVSMATTPKTNQGASDVFDNPSASKTKQPTKPVSSGKSSASSTVIAKDHAVDALPFTAPPVASSSTSSATSAHAGAVRATRSKPIKSTPLTNSTSVFAAQCLPQVRSPPKKRNLTLAHDDHTDITGLTGAQNTPPIPSSIDSITASAIASVENAGRLANIQFRHNDSYDLNIKKNRRPRLFGFTEMVPDSPDESSASASTSRTVSREASPTRQGSMEMIPRTKRYNGSLEKTISTTPRGRSRNDDQDVAKLDEPRTASQVDEKKEVPATTASTVKKSVAVVEPAQAQPVVPAVTLARRTSLTRSQSEIGLRNLAPIKPIRPAPLGSRTSAQRNESALKLDLNGIRETTDRGLGSAPMSSLNGPYSPATALLRKKSGEVVKPALKAVSSYGDVTLLQDGPLSSARSVPTTPGAPKYVHFDTQLERVKLFLHDQKPLVVSRNGSPTDCTTSEGEEYPFPHTDEEDNGESQLQIRLPNFPTVQPHDADVFLESIFLDDDRKNLKGIIRVRNIAFEKWVAVRFTLDWWQTTNETSATYKDSVQGGKYDRFQFSLKLQDMMNKIEEKNLFICLRYMAGTQEIWDNNGGSNYHVTFTKVPVSRKPLIIASRPSAAHGVGMISPGMGRAIGGRTSQWDLAGKRQDRMADLRMHLDRLSAGDDEPKVSGARFSNGVRSSPSRQSDRLPSPRLRDGGPASPQPLFSPMAGRYDFGASLSNARSGKSRSPSGRHSELPGSPGNGIKFATNASVGPSMEFYSPQLSHVDLPSLARPEMPTPTGSDRTVKQSSLHLDTLPTPVLQVQEPSPPVDYFSSMAPAQTAGPKRRDTGVPHTGLPRQYSEPPFPVNGLRFYDNTFNDNDGEAEDNALGLRGDNAVSGSPPSMASSVDSSASDSPESPVDQDLPAHRSSSVDDIANMSYKTILEQ